MPGTNRLHRVQPSLEGVPRRTMGPIMLVRPRTRLYETGGHGEELRGKSFDLHEQLRQIL